MLLHMTANTLYENIHSGSVVCGQHLGNEASVAFTTKPKAKSVKTTSGTIRKMNDEGVTDWMNVVGHLYASGCEICR